jgi:hypothetical protein
LDVFRLFTSVEGAKVAMLFDVKGVKTAVKPAYRRMTFIIHDNEYVDVSGNFKRCHRLEASHSHVIQDVLGVSRTADPRFSNPSGTPGLLQDRH